MKKFIRKNLPAFAILILITFLYFLLRLPNLTSQPVFADEGIYIRWAQVMRSEPSLRFLPLSDGKTPLYMWSLMPFLKVFSDPLYAGRILSVFSGFAVLLGTYVLGWRVFNSKVGAIGAFLIALCPMMVFFNRMALVDSMLAAFSIWSLTLALLLVRYQRIDLAILLGYAFGGALLTKTSGIFNLIALPVTIFTLKSSIGKRYQVTKIFGLWSIAMVMTLMIYSVLKLGPGFENLNSRNYDYVRSPMELLARPWDPFLPHFRDLSQIALSMLTLPIVVLLISGMYWGFKRKNINIIIILLWAWIPILIQLAMLQTFTARYVLFSIPPLLIVSAWFIEELRQFPKLRLRYLYPLTAVAVVVFSLNFNLRLLSNPANAPLPEREHIGYFEDWTAGYGLREISSYLDAESRKEPIVVGTEGSFGTLPDGLQIYFDRNPSVVIIGGGAGVSKQLRTAAVDHPTFFVANKSRYKTAEEGVDLLYEYPKAQGNGEINDSMLLFRVNP